MKIETETLKIVISIFLCGICIFLERALPFILFSKKNPPKCIHFLQKFIPPTVMACLVIYCLKDITFIQNKEIFFKGFIPQVLAVSTTVILHLIKKNTLLSILSGTILYMILIHIF